jgi:hypothetical protein
MREANLGRYAATPRELISAFVLATDRANEEVLESILHIAFRLVFCIKTSDSMSQPTVLSRNLFLEMVREGKIGGKDRHVSVADLSVTNGFASVSAVASHADAKFHSNYSLIAENGNWLLLQESVTMVPMIGGGELNMF